jgi:tetratricopeptide (TPR) repeat protein
VPRRLCGFLVFCVSFASVVSSQQAVLGRISFPNSGSPAAQPAFVRGVLLLHSFEYDDAIAAFREAQRLDPGFALAYWGEAMCYDQPLWYHEDVAKARAALARLGPTAAARASKAPTAREKGYLDAVERLFGDGDKASRDRAYLDRMRALSRAFPADDEAAAFLALALLASVPEGQRDPAISLEAGRIASAILKRNPEHPGAAHYALHAYDDGEHAAMGLEAARIYARIAPASSHARHMPSHVFLPLGMWDEAAASDESAWAASVARARRLGLSAAQHDFHALGWLQYEYLQQGRFAKARGLVAEVERAIMGSRGARGSENSPGSAGFPGTVSAGASSMQQHEHVESEIGRGFGATSLKSERASMRARLVVESGRWAEMKGQGSFDNVDELFALGLASVRLGDRARAESALEELQRARAAAPDAENRRLAEIMIAEVGGLHLLARGEKAKGLASLAAAARLEAQMPRPIARPYPIKPAAEAYGEALLAAGDAAGAAAQFQAALARTPRRAAALIGLARAHAAAGQTADASRAAKEFLTVWHLADADRSELAEAKRLGR